ncbi:MAG: hypothetical protein CBB69_011935 [Phycisphaera sp. TMED9]|nr:MAG: hypothetical protein CBB69_011935 [Phycisphaera sp. TMED9]
MPVIVIAGPMADMIDVTKRYIALIGGIAACMLLMMAAASGLISLQGLPGPTVGLSISPISATIGILIALVLAFGVALIVGRVVNAAVAAFVLGTGIAALSMQCGTHSDAVFAGANEFMIGIETLVWGVVVLVLAMGLMRWTGPLPDQPWNKASDAFDFRKIFSGQALRSSAAGFVMLAAVWLLSTNDLKGQAIFAATVGGLFAGLLGRIAAPRIQPVLLFASPVIIGGLGQLQASMAGGDGIAAFVTGTSPHLGMPMPMDFAAGSLMGVAMGLGWSRSFVEEHGDD